MLFPDLNHYILVKTLQITPDLRIIFVSIHQRLLLVKT